jgi:proline iminopeptidase
MEGYKHDPPFDSGYLQVSDIHRLHYEQYGKRDGKPVVFLHGGPGGQTSYSNTIFFDPAIYRVVLFDQRGSGKSEPAAELRENTSQHLVSDIEVLRKHLGIEKWHMVFGGSWGSTLALLYAETHPEAVGSLVIRGIFTVREEETTFARGFNGAARLYPELWEEYLNFLPEEDRADPYPAYHGLLTSDDLATRLAAAKAWNKWELGISKLVPTESDFEQLEDDTWYIHPSYDETTCPIDSILLGAFNTHEWKFITKLTELFSKKDRF